MSNALLEIGQFEFQILTQARKNKIANQALIKAKKLFFIRKTDVNTVNASISRQLEAENNFIQSLATFWNIYYQIRRITLYDFLKHELISYDFESLN